MLLTRENPKYSEYTTLPTINSIRTGPGSNAGFRLSHDTACVLLENPHSVSCDTVKVTV
jgi:hypothetical protein